MTQDISSKITTFFSKYPLRTFTKRQLIMRPSEPLPGIFYIVEGRVSQYDITTTGNEVVVNSFKPGAFFPMSTALNNVPNEYFFEASTVVTAHIAPEAVAVQFLQDNPDVTLDLLRRVYKGADGVLRRMAHLMSSDAKSRLVFELLNASYRFGDKRADGTISIQLNEGDLARQSGLARETVSRAIQDLKQHGLVAVVPGSILLKDVPKLEQLLQ